MPRPTWTAAARRNAELACNFINPSHRAQVHGFADTNVSNGRDMYAVNCWSEGPDESLAMWKEYAGRTDGVAVQSTAARLYRSIRIPQKFMRLDSVRYVDMISHDMGAYEGNQAIERAFLKDLRFRPESEIRLATMNLVCPGTLNADGSPPSKTQLSGPGMFDPERPGLYLLVDLSWLIRSVITAPESTEADQLLVAEACRAAGLTCKVRRSRFAQEQAGTA